jgi:excinuclease ABC subunit B
VVISPAKHFVTPYAKVEPALRAIAAELEDRVRWFEGRGKLVEAQRLRMRTTYDMEMMREIGFCSGIENYSRYLTGRAPGERPFTLIDYFPADFLTVIDESHATVPQIRGMYNGDRSRKLVLVEHGFRLPSALDNRPLNFDEFLGVTHGIIFTSATPGPFERSVAGPSVGQVIRPTGLLDPPVEVRPLKGQIDDVIEEIRRRAEKGERTLVTTLTKRTAEDLADYLAGLGLRVKYLHSEIDAIERVDIIRGLRKADFDCLVGINLLREGLDLPEVSLVAILDADKEGFLRSETSLVQTAGRAARHVDGRVILYADGITDSMRQMISVTDERRKRQVEYNRAHGITPRSVVKEIREGLSLSREAREVEERAVREAGADYDIQVAIGDLEREMMEAASALEFERAAVLRDQIRELKSAAAGPAGKASGRGGAGDLRYSIKRKGRGRGGRSRS